MSGSAPATSIVSRLNALRRTPILIDFESKETQRCILLIIVGVSIVLLLVDSSAVLFYRVACLTGSSALFVHAQWSLAVRARDNRIDATSTILKWLGASLLLTSAVLDNSSTQTADKKVKAAADWLFIVAVLVYGCAWIIDAYSPPESASSANTLPAPVVDAKKKE